MGEMRNAYKSLIWKSLEQRSLGRSKLWWKDNIEMDLQNAECKAVGRRFYSTGSEYGPVTGFCEHGIRIL
jgi:hypothetical protein